MAGAGVVGAARKQEEDEEEQQLPPQQGERKRKSSSGSCSGRTPRGGGGGGARRHSWFQKQRGQQREQQSLAERGNASRKSTKANKDISEEQELKQGTVWNRRGSRAEEPYIGDGRMPALTTMAGGR